MAKTKTTRPKKQSLPLAPWIYISDPTAGAVFATKLSHTIPQTAHINVQEAPTTSAKFLSKFKVTSYHNTVVIISDKQTDEKLEAKKASADMIKQAAISHGCNFVSINLHCGDDDKKQQGWGTNHMNHKITNASVDINAYEVRTVAEKIYKWLFTVLTVKETLHLIPDEQMTQVFDLENHPKDYEYCPIGEVRRRPKDAKICFVALVLSKPTIGPEKKLTWQVADKTGVANFYFQHRGPTSEYTWNWVLKLEPGQRKCLPRMPGVQIKESAFLTVAKAPFRATGAVIGSAGTIFKGLGEGLSIVGKKVKMGERSKWVPEADAPPKNLSAGYPHKSRFLSWRKTHANEKKTTSTTNIKIFNEKGDKLWKDDDSVASTTAGSDCDEKKETL